jgi:hypothetical protein
MFILYTEMCVVDILRGVMRGLERPRGRPDRGLNIFLRQGLHHCITVFIIIQTIAISAYTFKIPCRQKRNFPTDLTSGS